MKLKSDKRGRVLVASLPKTAKRLEHFLVSPEGQEWLALVDKTDPPALSTWDDGEAPLAISKSLVYAFAAHCGPAYHCTIIKALAQFDDAARGLSAAELAKFHLTLLKTAEDVGLLQTVMEALEEEQAVVPVSEPAEAQVMTEAINAGNTSQRTLAAALGWSRPKVRRVLASLKTKL